MCIFLRNMYILHTCTYPLRKFFILMILALYFSLFNLVLCAASNQTNYFIRFYENGLIQQFFLDFLPFNEQMKFKLTCRDFYTLHYTESELELLCKLIPGTHTSYKDASEALKSDIRKLLKYYKLEMACRKRDVEFTADNFCKLIHGYLFTSEMVRKAVYLDNLTDYKLYFGEDTFAFENAVSDAMNVPHFPQISLSIFKLAPYDYKQHYRLMKNACLFPYIFNDFFKNLALEKFNAPRDVLIYRIRTTAYQGPENLSHFQNRLKTALLCLINSAFIIISLLFTVVYQLFPNNCVLLIHLSFLPALHFIHIYLFENFVEYDRAIVKNIYLIDEIINRVYSDIKNRIFISKL